MNQNATDNIKKGLYFPFKLTFFYILITFLLSVVGPIDYMKFEYKYWLVGLYLIAILFFMFMGYTFGLKTKENDYNSNITFDKVSHLIRRLLFISFVSILIELIYLAMTGHISISVSSISDNYFQEEDGSSFVMIIRFFTEVFRFSAISLSMFFYKKLNKRTKRILLIEIILVFIISLFGYGQQKSLADLFIYLFVAIYVTRLQQGKKISHKSKRIIVLLLISLFFLLSFIQYQRYSSIGVTPYNYYYRSSGEVNYNINHPIFKVFGDKLGFGMSVISTGYLSTGYYGLSLCLQLPFEWTYGIGSSRSLTSIVDRFGIASISEKTYLSRMERRFGRNGLASWNTIFPWLASDFSFWGVLVYFFFFGFICARAWKEVLYHNNIISYLITVLSFIMIFYIPANNQIFHSYGSFISSWVIIILWLFKRKKFNLEK